MRLAVTFIKILVHTGACIYKQEEKRHIINVDLLFGIYIQY